MLPLIWLVGSFPLNWLAIRYGRRASEYLGETTECDNANGLLGIYMLGSPIVVFASVPFCLHNLARAGHTRLKKRGSATPDELFLSLCDWLGRSLFHPVEVKERKNEDPPRPRRVD